MIVYYFLKLIISQIENLDIRNGFCPNIILFREIWHTCSFTNLGEANESYQNFFFRIYRHEKNLSEGSCFFSKSPLQTLYFCPKCEKDVTLMPTLIYLINLVLNTDVGNMLV